MYGRTFWLQTSKQWLRNKSLTSSEPRNTSPALSFFARCAYSIHDHRNKHGLQQTPCLCTVAFLVDAELRSLSTMSRWASAILSALGQPLQISPDLRRNQG